MFFCFTFSEEKIEPFSKFSGDLEFDPSRSAFLGLIDCDASSSILVLAKLSRLLRLEVTTSNSFRRDVSWSCTLERKKGKFFIIFSCCKNAKLENHLSYYLPHLCNWMVKNIFYYYFVSKWLLWRLSWAQLVHLAEGTLKVVFMKCKS